MPPRTKKASLKQEHEVAADNDGTVNPASGAGWRHKNDVRSARFSFECKTTTKDRYSLKLDELMTAASHAAVDGKDMVFVVDIDGRRYYTVDEHVWATVSDGWPVSDFTGFYIETAAKSALLKRENMDPQETQALATNNDPIWVVVIQGMSYRAMRDYTWQMLRGD